MEEQTIARDTLNNDRNEEEGEDEEEERQHRIWFSVRKKDRVAAEEVSGIESMDLDINDAMALTSLMGYMRKKKNQFFLYLCTVEGGKLVWLGIFRDLNRISIGQLRSSAYASIELKYNDFRKSSLYKIGSSSTHSHQSSVFLHLKILEIGLTHQSFEWLSSWMADKVFPCLTELGFETHNQFRSTITVEPYLMWVTDKNLPSFKRLCFRGGYSSLNRNIDEHFVVEVDNILVLLGRLDAHLAEKLDCLDFDRCALMGNHLETLLIEIFPRFPNLCYLHAKDFCYTPNFLEVLDRIIRRKAAIGFNTKAKQVVIDLDPLRMKNPGWGPRLVLFLKYFKNVYSLGFLGDCPELKYALTKNSVGRRLIEYYDCSNDDGEADGSNRKRVTNRDTGPCLPISIWPILLERAQTQSKVSPLYKRCGFYPYSPEYKATGVYYLLREGPVFREYHNLNESGRKKLERPAADKTSSDMRKNDE